MNTEDLLKLLREGGLEDEAIAELLKGTLALLETPEQEPEQEPEPNEEDEAKKLLNF